MARVTIVSLEQAPKIPPPPSSSGVIDSRAYLGKAGDPIHLQYHGASPGSQLTITGNPADRLIYVWKGSAQAGGATLGPGSSAIVEFGSSLRLTACAEGATLLVFNVRERRSADREGGHVHLLPTETVTRTASLHGTKGVGGGLHADAACPTCRVWLHEQVYEMADKETALHSHSEDEIIFVTGGSIRLGQRIYGPGVALAIAANVKYGFHSGPEGLRFINFRGASPTYTLADGSMVLDEAELWRSALGRPSYLEAVDPGSCPDQRR